MKDSMYYEIDYDASPIPGVGKFVHKSEKLRKPERDPIRDLFDQMRDIARSNRSQKFAQFYDHKDRALMSEIFYRQAVFMKDFSDNYSGNSPYTHYFPNYQSMGYEQLRTYFTWRTKVRMDVIEQTSRSYAFLYMYELLGNIGVLNPWDGFKKILRFWKGYRVYDNTIDKYMLGWLKHYFIYYDMSKTFYEFVNECKLTKYYANVEEPMDEFTTFCCTTGYDIRKSTFFNDGQEELIKKCFTHVIAKLRKAYLTHGFDFDKERNAATTRMYEWKPFSDALFFDWMTQRDRRVIISKNETYVCNNNKWHSGVLSTLIEISKLVGFVFKHMESVLREVCCYKKKITANENMLTHYTVVELRERGVSIPELVKKAAMEFYQDATKVAVNVNENFLTKIRQEALETQEKLIVDEDVHTTPVDSLPDSVDVSHVLPVMHEKAGLQSNELISSSVTFTDIEIAALASLINHETNIKKFAYDHGIMPEVLADGINEKAMDLIGDSIFDEEFILYEDYIDQVKEWIK